MSNKRIEIVVNEEEYAQVVSALIKEQVKLNKLISLSSFTKEIILSNISENIDSSTKPKKAK